MDKDSRYINSGERAGRTKGKAIGTTNIISLVTPEKIKVERKKKAISEIE